MKLVLKNFRCYQEKEIDFGNEGLMLLAGPSGAGKSTILMSITFALYGIGTKLVSFGKQSCSVTLEFDELTITRTKRPNRLVVKNSTTNEEYEDDAAQSVIDEKFGNAFDITSYVQQSAANSFITMSPVEKLAFLEKFAFQGLDISKLKGRCQAYIRKNNEELIAVTSQLELASQHLSALTKPKKCSFPLKKYEGKNTQEKAIKNEGIRYKNSKILCKRVQEEINRIKDTLTQMKVNKESNKAKKSRISAIQKILESLQSEKENINFCGEIKFENLQNILRKLLAEKEYNNLRKKYEQEKARYETLKKAEINKMVEDVEHMRKTLWKKWSKTEITREITDQEEILNDCIKMSDLKESLEDYRIDVKKLEHDKEMLSTYREQLETKKEKLFILEKQKESYTCPACHTSLRFEGDILLRCDDIGDNIDSTNIEEIKQEITTLQKNIAKLEKSIPNAQNKNDMYNKFLIQIQEIKGKYEEELPLEDCDDISKDIASLKEYRREQLDVEKKITKLEDAIKHEKISPSLETLRLDIFSLEKEIKCRKRENNDKYGSTTSEEEKQEYDEETLRGIISQEQRNADSVNSINKQIVSLNKELEEIKQNYNPTSSSDVEKVEKELSEKERELVTLNTSREEHEKNMEKIEKYKKYEEEYERYKEWKNKVDTLSEDEQRCKKRYAASTLLKEKILEAESLAIANMVNTINTHAQEYLDIFFPVDPIVIRLSPFKQGKKKGSANKPQINIEIDYKGMEADLSMLSGGELARVILAFTLALSEIFNSPLLLLDECTASLDQEMTSIVMEGIREHFGNKLTVVIAHQVVSGDFDRQVLL